MLLFALMGGLWIVAGAIAARRPRAVRTGVLMIAIGLAWTLRGLSASALPVLVTLGLVVATLHMAVAGHLLLAFPSGRLERGVPYALAVAAYAVGVGGQVLRLLVTPAEDAGCAGCPEHLLLVASDDTAAGVLLRAQTAAGAVITAGVVAVLARRFHAASAARRRVLTPVLASGGALVALTGAVLAFEGLQHETAKEAVEWAALAAFAAVPCAFVLGAVRAQVLRGESYRVLAAWLERPARTGDLRRVLAEALGDPDLQLAYALGGRNSRYIDDAGLPVRLPEPGDGRVWTAVERAGRPIAALIYDAALAEEAEHVRAVGATVALALENERLTAELRARIAELSDSRARIVKATEQERRRVERDLHDGAQQRLASLALEIGLAIEHVDEDRSKLRSALVNARAQAEGALRELRAIAHGVHPPLLTERGLPAAIRALLQDLPLRSRYAGPDQIQLPAAIESALYFVVAEAAANVLKHARATRIEVRLTAAGERIEVEVVDNGAGGATIGGGLQGLQDRLGALDGELELTSRPGTGTALRARVRCAS